MSRNFIQQTKLSIEETEGLAIEAASVSATADRISLSEYRLDPNHGLDGPFEAHVSGPGPQLTQFHRGRGLQLARAFAQEGEPIATRSSYIYYSPGDFALLHHDSVNAHMTVIVGLVAEMEPLFMYSDFGKVTEDDVSVLNSMKLRNVETFHARAATYFGDRMHHSIVDFGLADAITIQGRHIAHARFEVKKPATVCACCYALFKPTSDWLAP